MISLKERESDKMESLVLTEIYLISERQKSRVSEKYQWYTPVVFITHKMHLSGSYNTSP